MIQKRCLNCGLYLPDDLDLEGDPIPDTIPASFGFSGVCSSTGKRVMDGWSCGKWTAKSDNERKGVKE